MLFTYREIKLKSKVFQVFEVLNPSNQLRTLSTSNQMSYVLGNAEAYRQLQALLLIVASYRAENALFMMPDASKTNETLQDWYVGAQFHQHLLFFNFEKTQIDSGDVKKVIMASKYIKAQIVDLKVPKYTYENLKHWRLAGTMTVKNLGKWLTVACNYEGYLYMSREAFDFTDIPDDPDETFAHSHLFALTHGEDRLDFRYFFSAY